jgi:replicative DNA helicase
MSTTCACGVTIADIGSCPNCGTEGPRYRQELEAREASRRGKPWGRRVRNEAEQQAPHPAEQSRAEPQPWDEPVPLGTYHVLPPFPVDALPPWLSSMVGGIATETQTPPDIPGTVALSALSAAAGGRVMLQVRAGWDEPVNLYTAAVAEPGTRKSAVYRALTAPLYAAERALDQAMSQQRNELRVLRERLENADHKARAAAIKAAALEMPDALEAAATAAAELEQIRVPDPVQLITGDISPEECSTILAAQGGRLAIMSAEGRIYDIITGRYSGGEPCLSPFLEGHAGDVLRVNRRGRYEVIERPAMTIGVCIQPAVLSWIASRPRLRGQGMLARFMYSVPAALVGYRDSEPPPVAAEVRDLYASTLQALVLSLAEWDDPQVLTLDEAARKVIIGYLASIEPRLRPDGDLYGIRDWAAKLAGAAARIAGLLHVAGYLRDGYAVPVSEETMRSAVRIADYYAAHARAAFGVMSADPSLGLARDMLAWLHPGEGVREPFSQRDAHRQFRERDGRATTAEEIGAALRLLGIHGYVRALPAPPKAPRGGRPASPRYEVWPEPPGHKRQNPENGG